VAPGSLARLAPPTPHPLLGQRRGTRPSHQPHAVDINRLPVMPKRPEIQTLLILGVEDHDGFAVLEQAQDLFPEFIPDSGGDVPHENPSADLQQPPGQAAPQAGGAGRQDEDDHSSESSSESGQE